MDKVCTTCCFFENGVCYGKHFEVDNPMNKFEYYAGDGEIMNLLQSAIDEEELPKDVDYITLIERIESTVTRGIVNKFGDIVPKVIIKEPDKFGCNQWR